MNKKMLSLLLVCFLLLTACNAGGDNKGGAEEETSSSEQPVVNNDIEIYGKVKAGESKSVSIPVAVKVDQVMVKAGEILRAGDTILTVDMTKLREEAEHLRSKIRSTENASTGGNSGYQKANSNIEQINTEISMAVAERDRMKPLLDAGAISAKEYQTYQDKITKLEGNLKTARLEINSINDAKQQEADTKASQLEDLRYELKKIEDAINSDIFVDNKLIVKDQEVLVEEVMILNGAFLPANQEAVKLIDNQAETTITANLPEEYYSKVKLGQKVKVKALVNEDKELEGKISFISQIGVQNSSEINIPIEISLNKGDKLPLNSNVDVTIIMDNSTSEETSNAETTNQETTATDISSESQSQSQSESESQSQTSSESNETTETVTESSSN